MKSKKITPRKRSDRNVYEIAYRIPGYPKPFYESFKTEAEAIFRAAEINLMLEQGTLRPPVKAELKKKSVTLAEFLDKYVSEYGVSHWGDSQYSVITRQIRDYIKPAGISAILIKDITAEDIDKFYRDLLQTKAVPRVGQKNESKTVGIPVAEKIHAMLKSAFNQAVKWGYISSNPAMSATLPKSKKKKRSVWSLEETKTAIENCKDEILRICILLAVAGSLRIGEILALQWDCVSVTEQTILAKNSRIQIKQTLKRCDIAALNALGSRAKEEIYFTFPSQDKKSSSKTVLVLKASKTESSNRIVYLPETVALELQKLREQQEELKTRMGSYYRNYNLVVAWPDGRPMEERYIEKKFKKLAAELNLPDVVFHSLRHVSTSMKLQYSGGDLKSVQGDTGHATSKMVMETYSEIFDEPRRQLAETVESNFFKTTGQDNTEVVIDEESKKLLSIIQSNPEYVKSMLSLK